MNYMGQQAAQIADAIEADANRDMYAAAPPAMRMKAEDIDGATALVAPTLPIAIFNRVIGLGGRQEISPRTLDHIEELYRTAGVSAYWVHLTLSSLRLESTQVLAQRGFKPAARRSWAKFLHDGTASRSPHTEFTLSLATSADAMEVATVVCAAYGMPNTIAPWFAALVGRPRWQVWTARLRDKIVATGSVFIHNSTAWLGIGATLAEYRGRGAQSALLAARVQAASAAGCTSIATETGEPIDDEPNPSLANIKRAGFVQVSSRMNYVSPGAG